MSRQWKRKASLVVASATDGLDLSSLRFVFKTTQRTLETPGSIVVRVYNLNPDTEATIQKQSVRLILQVGYEDGPFGSIFDGTIVQVRRGKENATTSYLDITASDGDEQYCYSVVAAAFAAGTSHKDRISAYAKAMGLPEGTIDVTDPSTLPLGVTVFGMGRDYLRKESAAVASSWWIKDGKLNVVPLKTPLPGEAVVLNSRTGMIGFPEQTFDGIRVRSLINPLVQPGTRLHIDNAAIQQAALRLEVSPGGAPTNSKLPSVADDGFYKALVVTHEGDSRGPAWWTDIICLSLAGGWVPESLLKRPGALNG